MAIGMAVVDPEPTCRLPNKALHILSAVQLRRP